MSKTREQLANRALDKLTVVGSGQSPDSEDTALADYAIDGFSQYISAIGLYTIGDLDAIDDAAFEWLAVYLAYFIALDFGKPQDDAMRQAAEYNLIRLASAGPTKEPLVVDYF